MCAWGVCGDFAYAQDPSAGGLVKCGYGGSAQSDATSCDFAEAINLINRLITYLVVISMPIAAIAFAYAGWLYLSAGGNSSKVSRAIGVFTSVGIGLVIILSGWLVFKFIANNFLSSDYINSTFLK